MKVKKILISALSLAIIWPNTVFAFNDVSTSAKNYDAITYLQENGIIQGYSDGTFRPDQSVNRAEFLKIILEGSDIPQTSQKTLPFSDIDQNAWYSQYIHTAYDLGVINGYDDGTFKPNQTINKAETLKILAKVQNWQTKNVITAQPFSDVYKTAWFTPYVDYAKTNGYLEETGALFHPENLMTRAGISEVIYRTLSPSEESEEEEITLPPSDNSNYQEISSSFYDGIILNSNLPNIFYKNEVYEIAGEVNYAVYSTVTVILENKSTSEVTYFRDDLENKEFSVSIPFRESGDFQLGIIPGETGQSKAADITIESSLPQIPENDGNFSSVSHSINYADDQTFLALSSPGNSLKKISFTQDSKTITYYSRQDTDKVPVNYSDFKNFEEGDVNYSVSLARLESSSPLIISSSFEKIGSKSFEAVEHSFDEIEESEISTGAPDSLSSVENISFSGTAKTNLQIEALIIKPNGLIDSVDLYTTDGLGDYFGTTVLISGGDFSFSYTPSKKGRYIVEINSSEGTPSLNHPIYIGGVIPLIPDYFDLHERTLFSGSIDLNSARNELLDYVNESRLEQGLKTISLDTSLNSIAQNHTNDMAAYNFFSHINQDGESPEDRRIAAGITTPVSENIAKDISIPFAHFGLMRSASHRENILNPEWTKVGIGITLKNGYLYISEEFSRNEITADDIENMKAELYDKINDARNDPLTVNNNLEEASKYINDRILDGSETLGNKVLSEAINTYNIGGSSLAFARNHSSWNAILESLLEESDIISGVWEIFGADIALDYQDNIQLLLILNKY